MIFSNYGCAPHGFRVFAGNSETYAGAGGYPEGCGFRVRPETARVVWFLRQIARGLLFFIVFLGASGISTARAQVSEGDEPELSLNNLAGENVSLEEVRGKVVLLDFWATWCGPCRESMPFYRQLYEEKKAKGFEVLAVSVDEDVETIRAFQKRFRLPFPILVDIGYQAATRFGPPTMPTAYLIDRMGRVRERFQGFRGSDKERVREAVEALLAEPEAGAQREEEEGGE